MLDILLEMDVTDEIQIVVSNKEYFRPGFNYNDLIRLLIESLKVRFLDLAQRLNLPLEFLPPNLALIKITLEAVEMLSTLFFFIQRSLQ